MSGYAMERTPENDLLSAHRPAEAADLRAEQAERRLSLLASAGTVLNSSLEYELTLTNVARVAVPALADWCSVHVLDEKGRVKHVALTHADPARARVADELRAREPADLDSPGAVHRVLRTGRSELYPEVGSEALERAAANAEEHELFGAMGTRSAVIVPMVTRGRTVGAITFAVDESDRRFDEEDLALAEELAGRCALAVNNAALYREAQAAERRSRLLVEAGGLLDSSLEYERTLREVAHLAVPLLADWCLVHTLEEGLIKLVAVGHIEPEMEERAWELEQRYPLEGEVPVGPAKVISTGDADVLPDIPDSVLEAMAQSEDHLRTLRTLGFGSAVIVPLKARGRTLGALTLASSERRNRYDEYDVTLAQELAGRCGLAVENAWLYEETRAAERRKEESLAELRLSQERFRLMVQNFSEAAIAVLDSSGRITSWNVGAERIYGHERGEILGRHVSCLYPKEDRDSGKLDRQLAEADAAGHHQADGLSLRRDGSYFSARVVMTPLRSDDGALQGFSHVTQDLTEEQELDARLRHQAMHDHLTGLPNRGLFLDRVAQALARSGRREGTLAVLFLDLDRFKAVNDSLGHAAGDDLLAMVAARLKEAVRMEDTVSRFGGDEFTVLCESLAGEEAAIAVGRRIQEALEAPIRLPDRDVSIGASIGVALSRGESESPEGLLRDADTAMYHAKERGRGRCEVFHDQMRPQPAERLNTESALRRAIEHDGFRVVYQPIFDLRTGEVIGAEALARWEHPRKGLLEPRHFIPLAEETGLIHSIGALTLEAACRQAARWRSERDGRELKVFVNMSAEQFAQPDLAELVGNALAESGTDPGSLSLEITESVLMSDASSTINSLLALKSRGIGLAIDDFGTGYSSLSYLKRFPVDYLKVDASFIEGLGRRREDAALVAAMINMAQALQLTVIAEGVETAEQLAELRRLGCEHAQGFHLARPQPAEALGELLSQSRTTEIGR